MIIIVQVFCGLPVTSKMGNSAFSKTRRVAQANIICLDEILGTDSTYAAEKYDRIDTRKFF